MTAVRAALLRRVRPELEHILEMAAPAGNVGADQVEPSTVEVAMRDGIGLVTDIYLPAALPAPVVVRRTPYGRAGPKVRAAYHEFLRRAFAVVAQDVRGSGDSGPAVWDYYVHEAEDGDDLVSWVRAQSWCNGFIAGCGGSYEGQTQWCMAANPAMSTIVPEVSGLGIAISTARLHLGLEAYARAVGHGRPDEGRGVDELERELFAATLAGGLSCRPLPEHLPRTVETDFPQLAAMPLAAQRRFLWQHYCGLTGAGRAAFVRRICGAPYAGIVELESLAGIFGPEIPHDAHTLPSVDRQDLFRRIAAPPLMVTGWYDWGLNDALATWDGLQRHAHEPVRAAARLIITPAAHNTPGYRDASKRPSLRHNHRLQNHVPLLCEWYATAAARAYRNWPRVIYFLMGADEWRVADQWPPAEARRFRLFLDRDRTLRLAAGLPRDGADHYVYDPLDPTPTLGGSIVSSMIEPGIVDVASLQERSDVLVYTTAPLTRDLDVVGPLSARLYIESDAPDTDFAVRLTDLCPDGRALQVQSGLLRTRYRDLEAGAQPLKAGEVYRLKIDMWATAYRFRAGHRLRIDIASADFPRFDRNSNRIDPDLVPARARQTVHRSARHASHIEISVLGELGPADFDEAVESSCI